MQVRIEPGPQGPANAITNSTRAYIFSIPKGVQEFVPFRVMELLVQVCVAGNAGFNSVS